MFGDKDEREKEILVLCQLSKTKPQTNLAKTYNPSVIRQRTYSQNIQKPSKVLFWQYLLNKYALTDNNAGSMVMID